LYALADNELRTALLRQVRTVRENYYLQSQTVANNINNIYDIPYRAIAMGLQDVWLVSGTTVIPIGRSETNEQFSTVSSPTGFWTYMIMGNQIKILPVISSYQIQLWYLQRPNTLVPTSSCAQIQGVNQTTGVLSFTSGTIPTSWTTSMNMDCVQDQPNFNWRFIDTAPTNITATSITFSSLPTDNYGNALIQVGDWISLAGQSCVIQMPVEMLPLLAQRTVLKYYESQNYKDKAALAEKKLETMEKDIFELLNPRVASEPKRVVADSSVIGGYRRWRAWQAT